MYTYVELRDIPKTSQMQRMQRLNLPQIAQTSILREPAEHCKLRGQGIITLTVIPFLANNSTNQRIPNIYIHASA